MLTRLYHKKITKQVKLFNSEMPLGARNTLKCNSAYSYYKNNYNK